jgi:hypothetical protein
LPSAERRAHIKRAGITFSNVLRSHHRIIACAAIFGTPVKCPRVREWVVGLNEESGESDKLSM